MRVHILAPGKRRWMWVASCGGRVGAAGGWVALGLGRVEAGGCLGLVEWGWVAIWVTLTCCILGDVRWNWVLHGAHHPPVAVNI